MRIKVSINTIILAIALLMLYTILILYFKKKGLLERYNMSLWGPVLMVKTSRGRRAIDRIARHKRFWWHFGTLSFVLLMVMMVIVVTMLLFTVGMAAQVPKEQAVKPQEVIALPGINPLLPFWYGLIALIIAVVVHELAHGILTRVGNLKMESIGVLFFIIPIGAFVEPDEEALQVADKKIRRRIYSAGPGMNFLVALVCALMFSWVFLGSLSVAHDGIIISNLTEGFPAKEAGLKPGMIIYRMNITHFNNTTMSYEYNDVRIKNNYDFFIALRNSKVNDTATVYVYYKGRKMVFENITLANRYNATGLEKDNGTGFLGVAPLDHEVLLKRLQRPIKSGYEFANGDYILGTEIMISNILLYTAVLPLQTWLMPFHTPITEAYKINGPLAILPPDIFWFLANLLYYIFWINLLVGAFNSLPIVPLDGGVPFRDLVHSTISRFVRNVDRAEIIANSLALGVSVTLIVIIIWEIIAPYVTH